MSNSGNWIRESTREAIYRRDDYTCVYCFGTIADSVTLTLDHILPRVDGGSNEYFNLVTCCLACNSSRKSTPFAEWVPDPDRAAAIRRQAKRRIDNIRKELLFERAAHARALEILQAMGIALEPIPF